MKYKQYEAITRIEKELNALIEGLDNQDNRSELFEIWYPFLQAIRESLDILKHQD